MNEPDEIDFDSPASSAPPQADDVRTPVARSYIQLSDAVGGLTPVGRCILDELKDWHKRIEKQGSREIHASYLLTLDKIPEALGKYTNLSSQGKSDNAIYLALRQILDLDHRGQNSAAYAYPFLIRNGNKIASKIAVVAPQKESKTDTIPYRQACFRYSQDLIKILLDNRAKKGRNWDELNPGNLLIQKNKEGEQWLYPKLGSLESEVTSLIKKGFGTVPYIPMSDFLADFVDYAKDQGMALAILNDYHIVIDELDIHTDGSFKKLPEVVNQILAHLDGLETFVKEQLREIAKEAQYEAFIDRLNRYLEEEKFDSVESKMNPEDRVNKFITIIESFPFASQTGNKAKVVRETVEASLKILKRLLEEKGSVLHRKDDNIYTTMKQAVMSKIPAYTKRNHTLLRMDFEEEVASAGITSEEKAAEYMKRLKDDVFSEFSYYEEQQPNGKSIYYIVDHSYMAAVIHKLAFEGNSNPELRKQLAYAKTINQRLSNPKHPELNSKLRADDISKMNSGVKNLEHEDAEKAKSEEMRGKYNALAGISTFTVSTLIFVTAGYYLRSAVPIFFGVPFSLIAGFVAAIFFREKSDEEMREDIKNSGKFPGASDWGKPTGFNPPSESGSSGEEKGASSSPKEEKIANIYKAADNFVFPKRFNKITDKVLDPKSLKVRISENLDNIKRNHSTLAKEKDDDKIASTVEYAVLQSVATILVPDDVAVKDMPSTLLINRTDLKAALFRGQLADFYREEMNKKKFDKKLVRYYTFLINTIEMEYFKYLPKKRL